MSLFSKILITGAALAAVKGLDNRLEVTHYTVNSKKIPTEFDEFRIVLFSDFHCDTTAGLADAIRNEKPDIICIPGDMTHDTLSSEPFLSLLKQIIDIAPVYIVSGNHDVWRTDYNKFVSTCKDIGAIYLQDEKVYINKGDAKIAISGIEDPFARMSSIIEKNLKNSLETVCADSDCFNVLLFHRANLFDLLCKKGFDLILSGHMHGGHFRLPGIGGILCPKTNLIQSSGIIFPRYLAGVYESENTKMIVTRGIGNPSVVPRLFNRPELCTITLKCDR